MTQEALLDLVVPGAQVSKSLVFQPFCPEYSSRARGTKKLIRNAASAPTPDPLNQNLHFNKTPN